LSLELENMLKILLFKLFKTFVLGKFGVIIAHPVN